MAESKLMLHVASSFVTLKGHKEKFLNQPTARLLNPTKNEIGRISKHILQNINKTLSEEIKVNGWSNTESVINWFKTYVTYIYWVKKSSKIRLEVSCY